MLRRLPDHGVDSIALVPYGVIMRDSLQLRFGGWERDDSLVALSRTAHSLGMRVMLKPQVWIRGSYPGDFDLPSDAERQRWLADYRQFTLHYAQLAAEANVDLFCIGTEFARLTRHETFWRDLIAEVRTVYPGPLTYAANWGPEFENLPFWDALDYMGLNNYYPIPDSFDLSDQVANIARVQARWAKPLLFTEAGSASHEHGHRQPWTDRQGAPDLASQTRAYEALLAAYWGKPWFHGAYWWKVGSNGFGGPQDRSHTPWNKPAMDVLRRWYLKPASRP
jgi:hypothetical protein